MKNPFFVRLQSALAAQGLAWHVQAEIFNDTVQSDSHVPIALRREATWDALEASIRAVDRSLTCNRFNHPPHMDALYAEYQAVVRQARTDIRSARNAMLKDPDFPSDIAENMPKVPATLQRISAIRAKRNNAHRAAGRMLEAECTAAWPTWVAPAARAALIEAFEQAYNANGRGRGKRTLPFTSHKYTADHKRRVNNLHQTFKILRQRVRAPDQNEDISYHPAGALLLAAVRMAERELTSMEKDWASGFRQPLTHPAPVNWRHLLTPEMRQRLKDSEENPAGTQLHGLTSYYRPAPPASHYVNDPEHSAPYVEAGESIPDSVQQVQENEWGDNEPCS